MGMFPCQIPAVLCANLADTAELTNKAAHLLHLAQLHRETNANVASRSDALLERLGSSSGAAGEELLRGRCVGAAARVRGAGHSMPVLRHLRSHVHAGNRWIGRFTGIQVGE